MTSSVLRTSDELLLDAALERLDKLQERLEILLGAVNEDNAEDLRFCWEWAREAAERVAHVLAPAGPRGGGLPS